MEQTSNKLVEELATLAKRMLEIVAAIGGETIEPVYPAAIFELIDKAICLNCKAQQQPGARIRRGLCTKCYQRLNNGMRTGKMSEADLIAGGVLGPKTEGGRQAENETEYDRLLAAKTKPLATAKKSLKKGIVPAMIKQGLASREHAREQGDKKPRK